MNHSSWHVIARCGRPAERTPIIKGKGGKIIWEQLARLTPDMARALEAKGSIMMASRFTRTHREIVIRLRSDSQHWMISPPQRWAA